jgi:hypothetical protein
VFQRRRFANVSFRFGLEFCAHIAACLTVYEEQPLDVAGALGLVLSLRLEQLIEGGLTSSGSVAARSPLSIISDNGIRLRPAPPT